MRIRLYSRPTFGGNQDEVSMWVAYVYAVNGGGGDISVKTVRYDTYDPKGFVGPVMSRPSSEEIFTLLSPSGHVLDPLMSGEQVYLRTADGHYVGIEHDEEEHQDYVVASALTPGPSETFMVTSIADSLLTDVSANFDPCGPSYAVAFRGRNWNYLTFPSTNDGPLSIPSPVLESSQTFALDFLDPRRLHIEIPKFRPGTIAIRPTGH